MLELLESALMQRALLAALIVGAMAPIVGTYLVQRRLALLGDGIGHIALTGVAAGSLEGTLAGVAAPENLALPGAVAVSIIGAVAIEWIRLKGRLTGDVALSILFYGGIATGVLLIKLAGGTSASLMNYLFGSISTVTWEDIWWIGLLGVLIAVVGLGLRGPLFAISYDEDAARARGVPVTFLATTLATLTALTVTVSMRVVGLLLVSALMIIPVVSAQLLARSFASTMALASVIGATVSLAGVCLTYFWDLPPGSTIVVLAIGLYILVQLGDRTVLAWGRRRDKALSTM